MRNRARIVRPTNAPTSTAADKKKSIRFHESMSVDFNTDAEVVAAQASTSTQCSSSTTTKSSAPWGNIVLSAALKNKVSRAKIAELDTSRNELVDLRLLTGANRENAIRVLKQDLTRRCDRRTTTRQDLEVDDEGHSGDHLPRTLTAVTSSPVLTIRRRNNLPRRCKKNRKMAD